MNNKCVKTVCAFLLAFLISGTAFAKVPDLSEAIFAPDFSTADFSKTDFSLYSEEGIFNPDSKGSLITLGVGFTLSLTGFHCSSIIKTNNIWHPAADFTFPFDKSEVNGLDRYFMQPYNETLDRVATAAEICMLTIPIAVLLPSTKEAEWATLGLLYANSFFMAEGIKEVLKVLVYRARPYMYFENYPQSEVESGDWCNSFPSGHTTISFMSASFMTYVFSKYHPDSGWKWLVGGLSYSAAAAVGALRMASGNHFLTDVLMGAAIGTACGILVPWISTLGAGNDSPVQVSPLGVSFNFKF